MSAPAPGMATANPFQGQPASGQRAVAAEGVQRVFRATRREPAPPQRSEEERFCRRNHPPIQVDARNQDMLGRIHSTRTVSGFNNFAFRIVTRKSFSTAAKPLPAMDWRATSTRSTGAARSC